MVGALYGDIQRQPGGSQIQGLIDEVVQTGIPFNRRELPIPDERFPEGTLYVDASILPIRDEAGNITSLLTVSIDVTQRVLAQHEIEVTARFAGKHHRAQPCRYSLL